MRVAVLAVLLVSAIAHADPADAKLEEAHKLEAQLEYEKALVVVDKVIAEGQADAAQLSEMHFLAGKLAAGLDRVDVAENHFAIVLTLRPDAKLPEGTSPKITLPFDAARGKTAPLRLSVNGPIVTVETDPIHLVSRTEVRDDQALAFDVYGNIVWEQVIEHSHEAPPSTVPRREHRPLYKRPIFWGGVAAGTASLAGLGAWRFDVAQNQWNDMKAAGTYDYSQLTSVEDRGRRWGLVANISLGAALLSTIATVAFAF